MAEAPKEFVLKVETPAMGALSKMLGGSMMLLTLVDNAGHKYSAAAITGPAVDESGQKILLHETEGAGLRLTDFKVVLP
jgi:hypothetical protein